MSSLQVTEGARGCGYPGEPSVKRVSHRLAGLFGGARAVALGLCMAVALCSCSSVASSQAANSSATTARKRSTGKERPGSSPVQPSSVASADQSVNLLVGNQASFSQTTGGWVGAQATTSWASIGGTGTLVVTSASAQSMMASSGAPPSTSTKAVPGSVYSGWTSVSSGQPTSVLVQPIITFYDSAGNVLTSVYGQGAHAVAAGWSVLHPAVAIAPPATASAVLSLVAYPSAPGQRLYVRDAWLTVSDPSSSPVVGPLHTQGDRILQANGKPLVMAGFDLYGLQSSAHPTAGLEEDVIQAKAWGANVIRLSLGEQFWLTSSCYYSPSYAGVVSHMVSLITSLGMVALLDLHFNSVSSCSPPGQQMMPDDPGSVEFWTQVASLFKDNPLVAFDLYNEPHGISGTIWHNGGWLANAPIPYQAAGMQQLYNAVRSTGADNLVVATGTGWGISFPSDPLAGFNIVYGVHAYTCPQVPPPQCQSPDPYDAAQILEQWVAPSAQVPVVVSEFGWPSANSGTFNANVISFAKEEGWGWIGFALDGTTTGQFDLVSQMPPSGPFEPSPAGMPLLAALAKSS